MLKAIYNLFFSSNDNVIKRKIQIVELKIEDLKSQRELLVKHRNHQQIIMLGLMKEVTNHMTSGAIGIQRTSVMKLPSAEIISICESIGHIQKYVNVHYEINGEMLEAVENSIVELTSVLNGFKKHLY